MPIPVSNTTQLKRFWEEVGPVVRLGAAVVAMEVAALGLATLGFGWVAWVAGVPMLLATLVTLVALRLSRTPRQRLERRRAARREHETPVAGGLMSGFFEVSSAQT